MSGLPEIYRRHLSAATGGDESLAEIWEPDGILEFPYAVSLGAPQRLVGVTAMADHFASLTGLRDWSFRDETVLAIDDEFVVEVHGSAATSDGGRYEQDYIVRFGVSPRGRIAWMREFWDPTRLPG